MAGPVLTIDINARLAKLEEALARVPLAVRQSSQGVEAGLGRLNAAVFTFGRTLATSIGVPLGAAALVSFLQTVVSKAAEGERGLNQLNAVLRATGSAAGLTGKDLAALGNQIENSTVFDDDAIVKAQAALLRFRDVQGDVFRDALRLAPSLASVLGTDLPAAATALGRALTDPEGGMKALRAAGVFLSEQEKDLAARFIETGDKASAQRIVLAALTKSIGGVAEGENAGLYGATKRMGRAWDDLLKGFGKDFSPAIIGIERLFRALDITAESAKSRFRRPGIDSAPVNKGPTPEQLEAEAGALQSRIKEGLNKAYLDQQSALKRAVNGSATAYADQLAAAKFAVDSETALYQEKYRNNAIASTEFYEAERSAAQRANQAIIAGLGQRGLAIERLMNAPSTDREERSDLITQLHGVATQQYEARLDLRLKLQALDIAEREAVKNLTDDYRALSVQLAEIRGDEVGAANQGFILANRDRIDRIKVESQSKNELRRQAALAAQEELNDLQRLIDARARLNDATKNYQLTVDELGVAQERISILQSSGVINELTALERRSNVNKLYVEILKEELTALEAIARQTGKREDIVKVEQLRVQLEALSAQTDLLTQKFNSIGQGAFSNLLQGLANNPRDFKNVIQQSLTQLSSELNKVAADNLSQLAFGKGGPLSGFGDFLAKIFGGDKGAGGTAVVQSQLLSMGTASTTTTSALAALTSGAHTAAAALATVGGGGGGGLAGLFGGSSGSGFGGTDSSFPIGDSPYTGPGFGTYADGADSAHGGLSWVGERGRELMWVPPRSMIVPNHRLPSGPQASGRSTTIIQNINVPPGADTSTLRQSAKRAFAQAHLTAFKG